jgi:arsenate reductase-like glutaredoxin family protein
MDDHKVKIYGTNGCHVCREVKQFMIDKKISYEEIDLLDEKNKEMIDKLIDKEGMLSVPIIEIDGETVVGFNSEEILCKLGIDKKKCEVKV